MTAATGEPVVAGTAWRVRMGTAWRLRMQSMESAARLRVYLWSIGVVGGIALVVAGVAATTMPLPSTTSLVAVGAVALLADATYVGIRFGHNTEAYTWGEFAVVLAIALLPAPYVVLTALCVGAAHVAARRAAVKVLFNTTSYAVGLAAATGVMHLFVHQPSWDAPVRSVIAITLGTLVMSLWNGWSVAGVIALSQGVAFGPVYRKGAWLRLIVCLGNLAVGLSVIALARWSPPTLVVLPPLVALLYLTYRGYLRALQERDVWQQLEAAAKELSRLDESEVCKAAVVRAASLFEADVAELSVAGDGGSALATVFVGTAAGVHNIRQEPLGRGDDVAMTTYRVFADGVAERAPDAAAMVETCVVAPLTAPQASIGVLRIGFHGRVNLTRREHQLLTTFAHTVSASVQNARLYTRMRDQAARNAHAAEHDGLTGLGNRSLLQAATDRALWAADRDGSGCALLLVDLDHFKEINDTLGHAAGDGLLREVGRRLSAAVAGPDTVARLGGDEFAILLPGVVAPIHVDRVAERVLRVLAEPVEVDGLRLCVEGSMGVACYPGDGKTFEELLQRADVAMYQAKSARGSYTHYRSDLDDSSIDRLALIADLRAAIDGDQLVVHFQPQIDLASGRPTGAEALVRWQHPTRGLLQPTEFVPLVEYSGLVRPFTARVLDAAIAECSLWHRLGRELTVAVNLSARSLLDRRLPADVAAALGRHNLAASALVLEITETTILHELDVAAEVLAQLRRMGVVLSVDDFGTGYSSLAFLQRVAVHELKIDRSFVSRMVGNDNDAAIVRATVQLACGLGLRTVAEGVSDAAVLERVIDLGCDSGQGYHWSPAVAAEEVRPLLGLPAITPAGVTRLPRPRGDVARPAWGRSIVMP